MQLRLHNTLTRRKDPFAPVDPTNVRMYVCGPTVYQRIHVGNARPFIVFDVLFRLLRHLYGEKHVTYVRNITDIEDKIIAQAATNGESIEALTERTVRQFHEDVAALGCLTPTHEPRATQHVSGMIAIIETLIQKGHAYSAEGHVLFHVPSMPAYGRLSGRDRADQIAGARVEVAPYKRDPADFVLWKPSEPDQPYWDSPWGRGRPGWHIECSAMSEALLGPLPFDIHGGGIDLIFPHHENEIAQSCCARDVERMARFWLHNGFVDMRGEKMSKSVGNVVRLDRVRARATGDAIRLWMLGTHYRQPIDFSTGHLDDANNLIRKFYSTASNAASFSEDAQPDKEFVELLSDDLNTPGALTRLHALRESVRTELDSEKKTKLASTLLATARLIGLMNDRELLESNKRQREELIDHLASHMLNSDEEKEIAFLVKKRAELRDKSDWAAADQIRNELAKRGILLVDTAQGTTWRRA